MSFRKMLCLGLLVIPAISQGLPFNDDMVDSQIKTGQVMRPKVDGTIPLGSLTNHSSSKQEATAFKNPRKASATSITNGKLLYRTNCLPCHGTIGATPEKYTPGTIVKFGMPAPNLGHELYRRSDNPAEGKTDGYIFATVRYGGLAIMPPLGYKLSANEIWDVVNYVRSMQGQ